MDRLEKKPELLSEIAQGFSNISQGMAGLVVLGHVTSAFLSMIAAATLLRLSLPAVGTTLAQLGTAFTALRPAAQKANFASGIAADVAILQGELNASVIATERMALGVKRLQGSLAGLETMAVKIGPAATKTGGLGAIIAQETEQLAVLQKGLSGSVAQTEWFAASMMELEKATLSVRAAMAPFLKVISKIAWVVIGVSVAIQNWDVTSSLLGSTWNLLVSVFTAVNETFELVWATIREILEFFPNLLGASIDLGDIWTVLGNLFRVAATIITTLVDALAVLVNGISFSVISLKNLGKTTDEVMEAEQKFTESLNDLGGSASSIVPELARLVGIEHDTANAGYDAASGVNAAGDAINGINTGSAIGELGGLIAKFGELSFAAQEAALSMALSTGVITPNLASQAARAGLPEGIAGPVAPDANYLLGTEGRRLVEEGIPLSGIANYLLQRGRSQDADTIAEFFGETPGGGGGGGGGSDAENMLDRLPSQLQLVTDAFKDIMNDLGDSVSEVSEQYDLQKRFGLETVDVTESLISAYTDALFEFKNLDKTLELTSSMERERAQTEEALTALLTEENNERLIAIDLLRKQNEISALQMRDKKLAARERGIPDLEAISEQKNKDILLREMRELEEYRAETLATAVGGVVSAFDSLASSAGSLSDVFEGPLASFGDSLLQIGSDFLGASMFGKGGMAKGGMFGIGGMLAGMGPDIMSSLAMGVLGFGIKNFFGKEKNMEVEKPMEVILVDVRDNAKAMFNFRGFESLTFTSRYRKVFGGTI